MILQQWWVRHATTEVMVMVGLRATAVAKMVIGIRYFSPFSVLCEVGGF